MPSVQGVFGRDRILRTCKVRVPEGCMQPEEIRRGAPALARETALSCPIVTKKLCRISPPRILCGIFCALAEETELKRFLVVRVSAVSRHTPRGSRACVENGVILSDSNEKALLYLSVPAFYAGFSVFWRRRQS